MFYRVICTNSHLKHFNRLPCSRPACLPSLRVRFWYSKEDTDHTKMTSSLLSPHAVSFTPTSRPASPSTQATNDPIESNSGAFVSLKQSKSSPSNGAVPLPKRDLPQTVETRPPVWSLTRGEETEQTAEAPLAALCQQHERANQVCCRTLKGDDERHLIDPGRSLLSLSCLLLALRKVY